MATDSAWLKSLKPGDEVGIRFANGSREIWKVAHWSGGTLWVQNDLPGNRGRWIKFGMRGKELGGGTATIAKVDTAFRLEMEEDEEAGILEKRLNGIGWTWRSHGIGKLRRICAILDEKPEA